ncbi:MAG: 3D domain-containing protein [Fimbriimonadaceae bacterium]
MTASLITLICALNSGVPVAKEETITKVISIKLPFKTTVKTTTDLKPGEKVVKVKGAHGKVDTTYLVTLRDGKVVSKKPLFSSRVEPIHALTLVGPRVRSSIASRGGYERNRGEVLTMVATGYDTSQQTIPGGTGRTATGIPAEHGVCAVDPRVIKLGTRVYIEGYGEAICADTGGAIKGMRIDLCFDSRREALAWGRRTVKVHILGR